MVRVALAVATAGLLAAGLLTPGLFLAIGLGIAAIGLGWMTWRRRDLSGFARIGGVAAMTVGGAAVTLGVLRVAVVLAAISHAEKLLG